LILEKIENNVEVETKPPSMITPKGAEGKQKMESIDSRIPKKSKQVGFSDKHCAPCKKHGGPHKWHNTCDCCKYNSDGTTIQRNGAQVAYERMDMLIRTVKHERMQRGKLCSDNLQGNKESFPQALAQVQEMFLNNSESDSDSNYSS
jgi:hypothetical protein